LGAAEYSEAMPAIYLAEVRWAPTTRSADAQFAIDHSRTVGHPAAILDPLFSPNLITYLHEYPESDERALADTGLDGC
jgi:hypothetical protein